jgi:hypothetical protein
VHYSYTAAVPHPLLAINPPFGSAHRERGIRTGNLVVRKLSEELFGLEKEKIIFEKKTYFSLSS